MGRSFSLSASKSTFRAFQPLGLVLDEFQLYSYHRREYPSFMKYFINEVDYFSQLRYKVKELDRFRWKALQDKNRQYLERSMSTQPSDPSNYYFWNGAQELVFENFTSVLVVFSFMKILQIILHVLPQRWALFRYASLQLRKQNTIVILLVSLIETSVSEGTVFCFSQLTDFFSLQWIDKASLIGCTLSLYILLAYSLCFYLLSSRYCLRAVRQLLYFSKASLGGCLLHSFTANFRNMLMAFINGFFF